MNRATPTVDLGYPTEARGRIPAFASIDKEAAFWDSRDFTDCLDEAQPVDVTVGSERSGRLMLRLERTDPDALARLAERAGVTPAESARPWLEDRLRDEAKGDAAG